MNNLKKIIKFIFLLILIIGLLILYGFFIEPKLIKVKEYKINVNTLTDNFNGFKIVHITDLHYGEIFDKKSLNKLVKSINEQEPDIVVLTGDLIDKNTNMTNDLAENIGKALSKIKATCGKYAITGDNDLKFDEWSNIISLGGFKDLNNTYDTIYNGGYSNLLIAGVSTMSDKESINDKLKTTTEYINSFEKDGPIYKILIMHEPDVLDDLAVNPFDLLLAGHSHGGQVKIPSVGGVILKDGAIKYHESHYKIESRDLYVSNGLGGNYFRLFNAPSYNLYRLVKES